jgi:hypothetical protein
VEDEDLPTKPPGDAINLSVSRNSFRRKSESKQKQSRGEKLLQEVESASKLMKRIDSEKKRTLNRMDSIKSNASSNSGTGQNSAGAGAGAPSSGDANVLKKLRKSFSRQLSKMSSFSEDMDYQMSLSGSLSPQSHSPAPHRSRGQDDILDEEEEEEVKEEEDDNSIGSISSFDSGHDLLRFEDRSSRHSSFGDTILLRSRSGSDLDNI